MNISELKEINIDNKPIKGILSKKTEALRLYLLIVSFIDVLVIKIGFFPKDISLFNIKLEQINYQSFLILLLILTFFFLIVFMFFSHIDWMNISLIKYARSTVKNWEDRRINLSADKYQKVIDALKKALEQDPIEIQKQVKILSQTFYLHPEDDFYKFKAKLEKRLPLAKLYQFVLPFIEIIIPILFGIAALIIVILEFV